MLCSIADDDRLYALLNKPLDECSKTADRPALCWAMGGCPGDENSIGTGESGPFSYKPIGDMTWQGREAGRAELVVLAC
ncbi:hypothetical protein AA15669_1835 [Saccharibacter floricola DSM 15669]|uniref:Uncharacterized protein n=1 Tax=Saccharibacter floricola DSM 15669 TaxID=1123227 RepID=A0ABQ0P1E7_9PROT|nr:hypothetical protein AA15669_1835 [Saccharibacter floricola DSM 15669]